MISKTNLIIIAIVLIIVSSCTINSNRMFRTPKNYEFDKIENELSELEYQIDVNDQLTFQLYTNNGFQLIDMFSATGNGGVQTQRMMQNSSGGGAVGSGGGLYLVRIDSLIEFPIIGDVNLVGKKIKEAEIYLENIFSEFYVDPFIVL